MIEGPLIHCEIGSFLDVARTVTENCRESGFWRVLENLTAVAFGTALGFFANKMHDKKRSQIAAARSALEVLNKLERECYEYWSKDYDPADSLLCESSIKATQQQIRIYIMRGDLGLSKSEKQKLTELLSDLYDDSMGGEFESRQRTASRKRIGNIADKVARISAILTEKTFG